MTFKTHPKHIFFRYEKDPKYVFLHEFFLICLSYHVLSKIVTMTKNTPFFPILHVFAPLNDVREYIAWSLKTTLITWFFFYEDDIQLQIQVPPPRAVFASINQILLKSHFYINQNALKTLLHGWAGSRVLLGQSRIIFKFLSFNHGRNINPKNYN